MDRPADSKPSSEGVGNGRQGHHPRAPIGLHDFLEDAFPLLAEDLRAARVGLDITSTVAAERAELDPALYRALEEGNVVRNTENVALMVSAARFMGLEELRFSYVDELQQYMKVDLSTDGPLTVFIDTLHVDVQELKEQSVFFSPYHVSVLVERFGFYEILASRQLVHKQLVELWIAAVFTLCLGRQSDYYVGMARDDPPDVKVLKIDGADGTMSEIELEITQYGSHSKDLVDVIGKKLRKKYQKGTVIVVLVEQAENIIPDELNDSIRTNNPYNQNVVIIGSSHAPGSFKAVVWGEPIKPKPSEDGWWEISMDANNASKGHRGYEGVVFKPKRSRSLPLHPVFVKELKLRHQM